MIDTLVLHPQTRHELVAMVKDPSHAVLLAGGVGSGKGTIARALAASYLEKATIENLLADAYVKELRPSGTSIGIEEVRELRKFLMLKTTGQRAIRRVVIIEDAHAMTTEAQNAFLKLLEEPPTDTAIIITADHPQHLLPTVNSRVQMVRVLPPDKSTVTTHFASTGKSAADIERAYLLSGGAIGLLHAILADDTSHPLVAQVQEAKELYGRTTFERLAAVEGLSKQKDQVAGLLMAFKRITKAALQQAIVKGQQDAADKWRDRLEAIHEAEKSMLRNANTKLLLTNLFLHL
jgi:DNA polymerase III delta prime subunit